MANTCTSSETQSCHSEDTHRHSRESGNLLPKGWVNLVAHDCFEQVSTVNLKLQSKDYLELGKYPIIDQGKNLISGFTNDAKKTINLSSPAVVFGDHTRVLKWIDFNFAPGADGIKVLLPKKFFNAKCFYHQMCSLNIPDKGYARHFKFFKELYLCLPPLAEQQEIARQLDTLLAQVEHTQARLQRIPDILKRFRQSVLADAVSGKLTKEWRRNNANVKPLNSHDRITEFRGRKLDELPETWGWLEFKRVAEIASNLVDPSENLEAVHIAPNHIESWTGTVSNYLTIRDDGVTSPKHLFFEGQIIYSKIRPYLAKVAVAEFEGLCSADMYPINSLINTKYLFRWMLTSTFTDWASNAESRSVLPKINQKDLNVIPVPTPPLEEQTQIVIRVEQLFAYADRIEQQAQAALERVNLLSQSILAKACRGELTADWRAANPDLISGENSAEALLAKIQAEQKIKSTKNNGINDS